MSERSRTRGRTQWIALAGALVMLAGVAVAWGLDQAAARVEVLRLVQPVTAGASIERSDLGVASIAVDGGTGVFVPVASAGELIGRTAAIDLPAGTLLQLGMWHDGPQLHPDERSVGAVLPAGHYPGDLVAGAVADAVELTETSEDASGGGPVGVRVLALDAAEDGTITVTLAVERSHAEVVAALAASQRLLLLGRPGEGVA